MDEHGFIIIELCNGTKRRGEYASSEERHRIAFNCLHKHLKYEVIPESSFNEYFEHVENHA